MDEGSPCPEDGDFFYARPDAAETEEAINKFISGLESQEEAGFNRLHLLLRRLPVPVTTKGSKISHTEALDRGFLPKMDEEQQKMFCWKSLKIQCSKATRTLNLKWIWMRPVRGCWG